LHNEALALQAALDDLCRKHYATFIENHDCMEFLLAQSKGFHHDLDHVASELASFKTDAAEFEKGASDIIVDLKRNRQTLQHHLQVIMITQHFHCIGHDYYYYFYYYYYY